MTVQYEAFPGAGLAESAFISPELWDLYKDIRAYERLLNESETTHQEQHDILAYLDSKWPYMGDSMHVTGLVTTLEDSRPETTSDDGGDTQARSGMTEYSITTQFYDGEVISRGFHLLSRPQTVAGEYVGQETIIGHYFDVRDDVVAQNFFSEHTVKIRGFAKIDEVLIDTTCDPLGAIIKKIEYFYPEVANDIDAAVLNANDQSSAVMSLADVQVHVSPEDNNDGLELVGQYVNVLFNYDRRVPSQFAFEGVFYFAEEDEPNQLTPSTTGLIDFWGYPKWIEFIPFAHVENGVLIVHEDVYVPALRVEVLARSEDDDSGRHFLLPISRDMYMSSVRSDHYADRNIA